MEQVQMSPGQIKKYLKQLRERQGQYLYYLGQLAHQAAEEGRIEDANILDAHNTLKEIEAQIAQWETSLEQIKAAKEAARAPKCPYCGAAVVRGAAFCPGCGATLAAAPVAGFPSAAPGATIPTAPVAGAPAAPAAYGAPTPAAPSPAAPGMYGAPAPAAPAPAAPAPAPGGKTCPSCGAAVDDDAVFCGECGARIVGASQPAAETAEAVEPPAPTEVPAAPAEPAGIEPPAPAEAAAPVEPPAPAEAAAPEVPGEAAALQVEPGAAPAEPTAPVTVEPQAPAVEAPAPVEPQAHAVEAPTPEAAPAPQAVSCPNCGVAVDDPEAVFCPECGTRLR